MKRAVLLLFGVIILAGHPTHGQPVNLPPTQSVPFSPPLQNASSFALLTGPPLSFHNDSAGNRPVVLGDLGYDTLATPGAAFMVTGTTYTAAVDQFYQDAINSALFAASLVDSEACTFSFPGGTTVNLGTDTTHPGGVAGTFPSGYYCADRFVISDGATLVLQGPGVVIFNAIFSIQVEGNVTVVLADSLKPGDVWWVVVDVSTTVTTSFTQAGGTSITMIGNLIVSGNLTIQSMALNSWTGSIINLGTAGFTNITATAVNFTAQPPAAGPVTPNLGAASSFAILTTKLSNLVDGPPYVTITGDVGYDNFTTPENPITVTGTTYISGSTTYSLAIRDAQRALQNLRQQPCSFTVGGNAIIPLGLGSFTDIYPGYYCGGLWRLGFGTNVTFHGPGAIAVRTTGGAVTLRPTSWILLADGLTSANIWWFNEGGGTDITSSQGIIGNVISDKSPIMMVDGSTDTETGAEARFINLYPGGEVQLTSFNVTIPPPTTVPPLPPPSDPPVSPPASPPATPPASPPATPPVSPPASAPATPPVDPPITPPVTSPTTIPIPVGLPPYTSVQKFTFGIAAVTGTIFIVVFVLSIRAGLSVSTSAARASLVTLQAMYSLAGTRVSILRRRPPLPFTTV